VSPFWLLLNREGKVEFCGDLLKLPAPSTASCSGENRAALPVPFGAANTARLSGQGRYDPAGVTLLIVLLRFSTT